LRDFAQRPRYRADISGHSASCVLPATRYTLDLREASVARNEDGEFELMLGNKQLLSVFFLMVLLLCLCFVGGYLLGRSAAPVLTAVNEPTPQESRPSPVPPATSKPEPVQPVQAATSSSTSSTPAPVAAAPAASPAPAPIRTAPQVSDKEPEPVRAKAATPPKATPAPAKQTTAASQPVPGRVYLQISATDKDKADVMVDMLRSKNLPGMASPVAERPGLYRVLVGPIAETAIPDMKTQLKANGFPGDQALRRVF
jgi:cytoskeletal protein RodZ